MIVEKIIIGEKASQPLRYVESVEAVLGRGLRGDRYYYHQGTFNRPELDQSAREVTLLDANALLECNERLGTTLDFLDLRRNLIVRDLAVELKMRLSIGGAQFQIVRSAPPCRYLSRLLGEDMMRGLKYIGGYRAIITQSGVIRVGDSVRIV